MDLFFLLLTSPSQISLFALLFLSHVGHSGAAQHHWRSLTVRGRDWIQPANDTTMKHRGHFLRQYGDSSHRLLVTDENQQKAEGKGEEAELESSRTFTETECLDQRIFRRGSSERWKREVPKWLTALTKRPHYQMNHNDDNNYDVPSATNAILRTIRKIKIPTNFIVPQPTPTFDANI